MRGRVVSELRVVSSLLEASHANAGTILGQCGALVRSCPACRHASAVQALHRRGSKVAGEARSQSRKVHLAEACALSGSTPGRGSTVSNSAFAGRPSE